MSQHSTNFANLIVVKYSHMNRVPREIKYSPIGVIHSPIRTLRECRYNQVGQKESGELLR